MLLWNTFMLQGGGNVLIQFPQKHLTRNAVDYIVAFESSRWRSLVEAKVMDNRTLQAPIPGTDVKIYLLMFGQFVIDYQNDFKKLLLAT